jgi:hypothetical protein
MLNLLQIGAVILVITWIVSILSYADGVMTYILLGITVVAVTLLYDWKKQHIQ